MANNSYDAIVVGGGNHGLIIACYLQKAGLSTATLERQAKLGGAVTSQEGPLPGFLFNECAHFTRFYSHPAYSDFNLREKGWDPSRAPKGKYMIGVEEFAAPTRFFSASQWQELRKKFEDAIIRAVADIYA